MDLHKEVSAAKLTDDLVVDILSRLTYKSFCRCKCAYKAWSAFSSDPDYRKKLPKKVTTGLLYQGDNKSAIPLVSLCPDDGEINGILADVPHYEHLEFLDCCNGLVLCKYRSSYTSTGICRFVVCNPATREWRILPDTHPGTITDDPYYETILAFDPSWSPQFYIFNFHLERDHGLILGTSKLEIFRSESSTWLEDDTYLNIDISSRAHLFVNGMLYLAVQDRLLVFEGLEAMSDGIPPYHQTIRLPPEASYLNNFTSGCFGKSSGILHYALPHVNGRSIVVWTLDDLAHHLWTWTVKCHLSMTHAFGKDEFVHYDDGGHGDDVNGFGTAIIGLSTSTWRESLFSFVTRRQRSFFHTISARGNSTRYKTSLCGIGTMSMYHATQSFQPKNLRLSECQLLFNVHLWLFRCDMLNHLVYYASRCHPCDQSSSPAFFTFSMQSRYVTFLY